jgi:glutaconate CoA-transferase subunit B
MKAYEYTSTEIQAYTMARQIKNGNIVIVGTGLPIVGAILAKKTFAPDCALLVEAGLMDCDPLEIPRSVSDLRMMEHCAVKWPAYRYLGVQANAWLHGDENVIGFIGGAEIDPYGNVGSTSIGDYFRPKLRLPGSGGANGIATYCNTIISMPHEKRHFRERIDYITSPGWIDGPGGRAGRNLPADRGPRMVVSDLGVLAFDDKTKRMVLTGYYPFTSPAEIQEKTGFALDVSRAAELEPPPAEYRDLMRAIDPQRIFMKAEN